MQAPSGKEAREIAERAPSGMYAKEAAPSEKRLNQGDSASQVWTKAPSGVLKVERARLSKEFLAGYGVVCWNGEGGGVSLQRG